MIDANTTRPTIGILSPGEMGCAVGKLLVGDGFHVVTTLAGRSARTAELCNAAGLAVLGSLEAVADTADVIISLVPPTAAVEMAEQYLAAARPAGCGPIYVDANSISPVTVGQITRLMRRRDVDFVDAAIHGLASRLQIDGTTYVSGPSARKVEELFGRVLQIRVLGDAPGQASLFKMLLGGLSKSLTALFLEISLTAREAQLTDEFLEAAAQYYPGVLSVMQRLLPTYPKHSLRRADELIEVERTMRALSLEPHVVSQAQRLLERVGNSEWSALCAESTASEPSLRELIELLHLDNPLRAAEPACSPAGKSQPVATEVLP